MGSVLIILAGPAFIPSRAVFTVGSALTGVGTAALSLNAGLLLCSVRPRRALTLILYCELVAALMQFMVLGLPQPYSAALFVALPLVSAACFAVGASKPAVPVASESERLKPVPTFYRFLLVVGILGVAANFGKGLYQVLVSPLQLSEDGSITAFVTAVCLIVLVIVVAVKERALNFGHLFYPMALVIIFSLLVTYFFPGSASVGVVLSGVAFQLFDVVMWYIFSYIVYQSKASAVLVVALGRAVIAFGVTAGNAVGSACATMDANALPLSTVVFVILFAAAVAVFFLFPEKQVDRLLLPIPDEDAPSVQRAAAGRALRARAKAWRRARRTARRSRKRPRGTAIGSSAASSWATRRSSPSARRKCSSCWRAATDRSPSPTRSPCRCTRRERTRATFTRSSTFIRARSLPTVCARTSRRARSNGGGALERPANISPHSLRMLAWGHRSWL